MEDRKYTFYLLFVLSQVYQMKSVEDKTWEYFQISNPWKKYKYHK